VENSIFFWRFQKIIWGFFYGLSYIEILQGLNLGDQVIVSEETKQ